jgi:hypothetical protein
MMIRLVDVFCRLPRAAGVCSPRIGPFRLAAADRVGWDSLKINHSNI